MHDILKIRVDGDSVATVRADQVPCEVLPDVRVSGRPVIEFEDAAGIVHRHTTPQASGWLHLSARVHAGLSCQADAVVTAGETHKVGAALGEDEVGVRFQPFFLAGAQNVPDLTGRGLFARGLHFRGTVTPGNIILSCECNACHRSFLARSFHAGFSDVAYFYSASGHYTLVVGSRVEGAPVPLATPDAAALARLEAALPIAPDGTRFGYLNPFRCPHCGATYIDFAAHPGEREGEYYGLYFPDTPPIHAPQDILSKPSRALSPSIVRGLKRLFARRTSDEAVEVK